MAPKRKSAEHETPKEKKVRAKAKGKKQQTQDLRNSFQAAAASNSSSSNQHPRPQDADGVQKSHQSLFVTYLKGTADAKKDLVSANQASRILRDYKGMTNEHKKTLVANFFKAGARKSGLQNIYTQVVKTEAEGDEKLWQGYATPDMILDYYKVPHLPPLTPPTIRTQEEGWQDTSSWMGAHRNPLLIPQESPLH